MFKPGTIVRAKYRPVEFTGEVLDVASPEAWADTMAFPGRTPSAEQARAHVDDCIARGLSMRVPVRWDFGGRNLVYFENAESLIAVNDTAT